MAGVLRKKWRGLVQALREESWEIWALTPLLVLMMPFGLAWVIWNEIVKGEPLWPRE